MCSQKRRLFLKFNYYYRVSRDIFSVWILKFSNNILELVVVICVYPIPTDTTPLEFLLDLPYPPQRDLRVTWRPWHCTADTPGLLKQVTLVSILYIFLTFQCFTFVNLLYFGRSYLKPKVIWEHFSLATLKVLCVIAVEKILKWSDKNMLD